MKKQALKIIMMAALFVFAWNVPAIAFDDDTWNGGYMGRKSRTTSLNDGGTLTRSAFGWTFDIFSPDPQIVYLPAVETSDAGGRIRFIKSGTGGVSIYAGSGDQAADSAIAGWIGAAAGSGTSYYNITLQVGAAGDKWFVTGSHGTWITN